MAQPTCSPDTAKQEERKKQVRAGFDRRYQSYANRLRSRLADFYVPDKAAKIKYAEAFELCEYGRRPDKPELKRLFPLFDE